MTLAIVFGGGGARGAFQAGAWAKLAPYLQPDFAIGSSIGAINAWASTRLTGPQLCDWWLSRAPNSLPPYHTTQLDAVLSALLALPQRQAWPALAVTTRIGQGVPHVVTLTPATGLLWLRASCALPGWFAPVTIAGQRYVDGGVRNDLPVVLAKDIGATTVLALSAGGLGPMPGVAGTAVLTPPAGTNLLDFSPRNRRQLVAAGQRAGARFLQTDQFRRLVEISAKKVQNGK